MYRLIIISVVIHAVLLTGLIARGASPVHRGIESKPIDVEFIQPTLVRPVVVDDRLQSAPVVPPVQSATQTPAPVRSARSVRIRIAPIEALPQPSAPQPPVRPTDVTATPVASTLTAASLFLTARTDVQRVGDVPRSSPAPSARIDSNASQVSQARAASQGFVAEMVANANPMEPVHVHEYYSALSRRMRETWRPGFYHTPTMVDALMALPRRMASVAQRYRTRASSFAMTGRPDDPNQPLIPTTFEDRSSFTTRTTSSIVEVEQDENGRVIAMRIVQSSRVRSFDDAAIEAVRAAFPLQAPVAVHGGRRSRWEFDVAASRDAIVPIAGFMFDESNGFFEMHYPGALHVRTRIRPVGSRPLDVPWPPPRAPLD